MPRGATRLALGSLVAFALLYLIFTRTGVGREVDQAALLGQGTSIEVDHVKLFDAGPVAVAIAVSGLIAWARLGFVVAVAIGAAIGGSSALALALTRALPQVVEADPSFPSGDATLAMAVACAIVLVARPWHRGASLAGAATVAIVVGVGLVAVEWHRPAEVAAGFLLAVACACPVLALPAPHWSARGRRSGANTRLARARTSPDRAASGEDDEAARRGEGAVLRREAGRQARLSAHPVAALFAALTALFLLFAGVRALILAVDYDRAADWLAFLAGELLLAALALLLLVRLRDAMQAGPEAG